MREGRDARAPLGLFCYRVDAERYLVGGAISNAGNLRAWCMRELRLPDDAAIEAELAKRPGPCVGLTVLPFWTAERAPRWNEEDTG
jgi:gluconokinase